MVHTAKNHGQLACELDGCPVPRISAFLFAGDADDNPARLIRNPYFSACSKIYGQRFVFADDDPKATPLAVKEQLEAQNPHHSETAGKDYYEFRAALMVRNNEGLTKTYNRFHDPNERSPDLLKLRELHAAMDRAVLDAYGWIDLKPPREFLLNYEEEEAEEESGGRRRKKPWRYRWPDDLRDEVLARLLELNKQRAEQEQLRGAAAEAGASTGAKARGRKRAGPSLPGFS